MKRRIQSMTRSSQFQFALALMVIGILYSTAYLRLTSRWWFEDDPNFYAYASTIHNPALIFTDPEVLRHLGGGLACDPMQLLSFWIDVKLGGFSTKFAYGHQICSFLLTLLFLYLFLALRLRGNTVAAFAGGVIWALLPSTAAVIQFLATRHYLEGLLFTVLTVYLAERLGWRYKAAVLVCALAAMLYKELYAPVVIILLLVYAWRHRDRVFALLTVGMACAYAIYRTWILGPRITYGDMPLLTPWQYAKFLTKLPYTLSSNYGGYCIYGIVVALCVYGVLKRRESLGQVLCFAGLWGISLLAILPVSYPLYGLIRRPDPWYRIVFLLNTILVCFGTYFAACWTSRRVQGTIAIVALLILLPGVGKTRALWAELTSSAEREGKFYLNNPDKIVLSTQEAWWFLPGIDWMWGIPKPHYILSKDLPTVKMDPGVPLWRFDGNSFVPDYEIARRPVNREP